MRCRWKLLAEQSHRAEPASRRAPCSLAREGSRTGSPGTPSVVSRTCEPKPTDRALENLVMRDERSRTVSPSLRPRPASAVLRASFWLAPSRSTRPCDLPVRQDARCVQPTSATRTTLRAPAPRAFPARSATFAAWTSVESWAPRDMTGVPDVSRRPRTLRRTDPNTLCLVPSTSRLPVTSVGVLFPRRSVSIEPLTPVSLLPLAARVRPPSRALHARAPWGRSRGSEW